VKQKSIQIRNLSIGYRRKKNENVVARNIDSTLYSGELTCLIGANGVGKSTLMRTLAAFQPALAGEIRIEDKNIADYSAGALAKIISVVLTERVEINNLSVSELVSMGRSPYTGFWGTLKPEDEAIVQESLRQVGASRLSDRTVETLSDGERQKVMIAKALTQQTPIIFLDEPTAFLDFPGKVEILQTLHRLSRSAGKTIFLSTHDLELALQVADTLWLMDKNRGLTVGSPERLAESGCLENLFPDRNVVFDRNTYRFKINPQPPKGGLNPQPPKGGLGKNNNQIEYKS
jgi:iron complex transport system ATP-binding protein